MEHKYIAKVRTRTGKIRYVYKAKASPIERDGIKFGDSRQAKEIRRQGLKFHRSNAEPIPRASIKFRRSGAKKISPPDYTKFIRRKAKRI